MSKKSEKVSQKSAAEFFSEHQQIAGFDNAGKSLFTTIREFVENSLDAAESMHVLPEINVHITEYTEKEHNVKNGIDKGRVTAVSDAGGSNNIDKDNDTNYGIDDNKKKPSKKNTLAAKESMYYMIVCKDNGCGIPAENIADMLGRVLSGSKHGVRQTRGKFGLGAKMALIWSKKSSGLPIRIRTAHSTSPDIVPATVTTIVLDIDIYKNEPRIISKRSESNHEGWRGAEISVTINGNWGIYKSRILQYFQQLAVITPYAQLSIDFTCERDDKKSFTATFQRRSDQMPPIASEILPHPKSLNNITLTNLLRETKYQSIAKFLSNELSGISGILANKIVSTLSITDDFPGQISTSKIAALCQVLRDEQSIRPPAASCLSPAGEYNMRLGILKELQPKLVATFTDKPGSHEGHPFIIEAAVSIGGPQLREGINVYRFANRIPLLFETGADVVTQVATKRINWSSYHIDPKKDNVGVFVSIVSTKIPFKGTSKEYVGDDVTEIQQSVKRTILGCCQQLRVSLAKSIAKREEQERKKILLKYIPDISRAVLIVLDKMESKFDNSSDTIAANATPFRQKRHRVLDEFHDGMITEDIVAQKLTQAVEHFDDETKLRAAAAGESIDNSKRVKYTISPVNNSAIPNPVVDANNNNWIKISTGLDAMIYVTRRV